MVRVEVHLKDGTRMEETVEAPRGSESSFASQADVVAKFLKLAAHAVPTPAAERIVDLVLSLERRGELPAKSYIAPSRTLTAGGKPIPPDPLRGTRADAHSGRNAVCNSRN